MKKIAEFIETDFDLSDIRNEVLSHKQVQDFLKDHNLDESKVDASLTEVYRFVQESTLCNGCTSLDTCKMDVKGYQPKLSKHYSNVMVKYEPCHFMKDQNKAQKAKLPFKTFSTILQDYDDFEITPERQLIMEYLIDFIKSTEFMRGLYISGKPGIGKSRILTVLAKKLAKRNEVLFVEYPDFVREIKKAMTDGTLEYKVEQLKRVPILVIDNFGPDGIASDWFRDEILLPILNFRAEKKKPIFIATDYPIETLEEVIEDKIKDAIKTERIFTRIKSVSKPIVLKG